MSFTLTPINILNATGASVPMSSYNDGTNNAISHVILDGAAGTPVSPATAANQLAGSSAANTSGGASTFFAAAQSNTVAAVKASSGNLYSVSFYNPNTAMAYVQLFDLATGSVTLGTTPPKMAFAIPAGGYAEEKFTGEAKVAFLTAISAAATTTATGSTAPATGVMATIVYK